MLKKFRTFSLLFVIIFVLQLLAITFSISTLHLIIKPCIVLSLGIFFCYQTKLRGRFHKRLFTGLVFAWLGDLFLMAADGNNQFFLYGLGAFLVAHLYYIRAFYLDFRSAQELDKRGARWAIALCSLFGMGFYAFIRSNLGEMRIPVMVYTFVISLMVMMAVFRNQRVNSTSFNLIFAGAILFVVSDALLAYNKFVVRFDLADLLILGTYMVAQYLIVMGGAERKLLQQQQPITV